MREEFQAEFAEAADAFSPAGDDDLAEIDADLEEDIAVKLLFYWLFDHRLADGCTLGETYLRRFAHQVDSQTRVILERMARARLRPYEVEEIRPEEGLRLRDLWGGEQLEVVERAATRQLERWDVLAARIAREEDGVIRLQAAAYLFEPRLKQPLLDTLREAEGSLRGMGVVLDEDSFFRQAARMIHRLWFDQVVHRPPPHVVTAEGDPVEPGRVRFDVLDEAALRTALDSRPEFEAEESDRWAWLESGDSPRRSLGHLAIEGAVLVLEVVSRERARRGRELVKYCAGPAVRHRSTRFQSLEEALKREDSQPEELREPPAADAAEVSLQFKDHHYRSWSDHSLPALDGHTPREAARSEALRPRLVDLLKEMENAESRGASAASPAYDFGWIWEELGLASPPSAGGHRALTIDAEELGMALTWHGYEGEYFLDTRKGEVLLWLESDDELLSEEELEEGLAEGRYVAIEPLPSSVGYRWMEEFADSVRSERLRELLDLALRGKGAFRRFKDVLVAFPEDRERWFAFEAERLDEEARRWLEDNDIHATLAPRRRPSGRRS
jgi:hypothetical protein